MKSIIGHSDIRRSLAILIRENRFPQTSLFHGMSGCGKKLVALEVSQALLCEAPVQQSAILSGCGVCPSCQIFAAGNHPDFHFISDTPAKAASKSQAEEGGGEKSSASKTAAVGSIKAEQIVELKKKIAYPPLSARFHVTLIDNAEFMTETTANSLLKLLEEPREGQIFILVSGRLHRLLVTIRSRCSKFHFLGLSTEDCRKIIGEVFAAASQTIDEDTFAFYATCFPGSPSLIAEAMRLPLGRHDFERLFTRQQGFLATQAAADGVSQSGADPRLFLNALRGFCLKRIQSSGGASGSDVEFLDRLDAAQKRLDRHIPADFVLENLFI